VGLLWGAPKSLLHAPLMAEGVVCKDDKPHPASAQTQNPSTKFGNDNFS